MSTILNSFELIFPNAQTAQPAFDFHPEIIVGALIGTGDSLDFDADDLISTAAFMAKLQAGMLAEGANRLYPVYGFCGATNNSEKPVIATLGYGDKAFVRDGKPGYTFEMWHGSFVLLGQLRKLNNDTSRKIALVDQKGRVLLSSADGVTAYGFDPSVLNFGNYTLKDGSKPDTFTFDFVITDPEQWYTNMKVIDTGQDLRQTLKGLLPVTLSEESTSAKTALVVKAVCGATNWGLTYHTEIVEGNFTITKDSDGSVKTLTSVTVNSTTGIITITPSSPLSATTYYTLSGCLPSALVVDGIGDDTLGYEFVSLPIYFAT